MVSNFRLMKNLIIASTSTLHGGKYLSYMEDALSELFQNTNEILFIPYARPQGMSYDAYTKIAGMAFSRLNKKVVGIISISLDRHMYPALTGLERNNSSTQNKNNAKTIRVSTYSIYRAKG